jgi:hypothetical protein
LPHCQEQSTIACRQCIAIPAAGGSACTGAKPMILGRSRTLIHDATASASDSAARPANTTRHDVCVTSHASGAPAITAPRLPANIVKPFNVAKRSRGETRRR